MCRVLCSFAIFASGPKFAIFFIQRERGCKWSIAFPIFDIWGAFRTFFIFLRFSENLRKKAGAKREFNAASQIFSENLRDSQRNKSAKRASGSVSEIFATKVQNFPKSAKSCMFSSAFQIFGAFQTFVPNVYMSCGISRGEVWRCHGLPKKLIFGRSEFSFLTQLSVDWSSRNFCHQTRE